MFSYLLLDSSQPFIFSYFIRTLNVRIESQENWTPAQNGSLDPKSNLLFLLFTIKFSYARRFKICIELFSTL